MKSRSRHHRSKWAHCNTPDALRRRRAKADARREAIAAALPPVYEGPAPLSEWQTITVTLYVPTHGRCDQHAAVIDGQRVGLLSATEIGRRVAAMIHKRPSDAVLADMRRDDLEAAREAMRASSSAPAQDAARWPADTTSTMQPAWM